MQEYVEEAPHDAASVRELRDCEEFLSAGIDACRWLRRADQTMREADRSGIVEFTLELRSAVQALCELWIRTGTAAERWIDDLEQDGLSPSNLQEFRAAQGQLDDFVAQRDWLARAGRGRNLAAADEEW
ncbi:MAG: hypothetical protein WD066_19780 [Planctomycetaceae bacterium]